jgi:hypothetical protein
VNTRRWRDLALVLAVALVARLLLLASGAVSFHSDEAVIGLMARHILQGARPTFFYGQAYMGSLDAWAVALGFTLLGESVLAIRIVQSGLYLLVVALGWLFAWQISGNRILAGVAGLVLAVPTVNVALYSTASLGGYNETMLFGGLLLWLGYGVSQPHPLRISGNMERVGAQGLAPLQGTRTRLMWLLVGLIAGVGWWANGLIIMYALPVGLLLLYRTLRPAGTAAPPGLARRLVPLAVALAGFVIGSAPWWVYDFTHDHAAIRTFLVSEQTAETGEIDTMYAPPEQRALGLVVAGIPALVGMRFPWSADFFLLPVGVLILAVYSLALVRLRAANRLCPDAARLVLGMIGLFMLVFVASTFGIDPTGRYFVPLALPLAVLVGSLVADWWGRMSGWARALPLAVVVLVVGYQAAGQWAAANTAPGFTTQLNPVTHLPNDHDAELIAFLTGHGLTSGCTQYWVAFRLAFLSGETLQYSPVLPYKTTLRYNRADDRYPPYTEATTHAERIAYITTSLPQLDARLEGAFAAQGFTYQLAHVGGFTVYYDFAPGMPLPCIGGE